MVQEVREPSAVSVLVVEDDAALRALFQALLRRQHFDVEMVTDGAQALERLGRRSYSVMLLDLMMPSTNGFDVIERLTATSPAMLRRTIIITGVSERDLAKIDCSCVFGVVRKPFDIDRLVDMIHACGGIGGKGGGDGEPREPTFDASVRRFEKTLPLLRRLMSSSSSCDRELMLRKELRLVAGRVAALFAAAAAIQHEPDRAEHYASLARAASRLAVGYHLVAARQH